MRTYVIAYEKGRQAFKDNLELKDNPYPENVKEFAHWECGWSFQEAVFKLALDTGEAYA